MNPETVDQPPDQNAALTPVEPIAPAPPSTLRKIFIGQDGLRAGWSLLIFIAMFAALAFCANRIGHRLHAPDLNNAKPGAELSPLFGIIVEAVPLVIVLFLTWIMSKIERRPDSVYGLGDEPQTPALFRRPGVGRHLSLRSYPDSLEERAPGHRPPDSLWQ